jgi:hypothetical protein
MMLVFWASVNSPTAIIVETTVTKNSSKCVLKGILIQVSDVEERKTQLFHCLPHKLNSSNFN